MDVRGAVLLCKHIDRLFGKHKRIIPRGKDALHYKFQGGDLHVFGYHVRGIIPPKTDEYYIIVWFSLPFSQCSDGLPTKSSAQVCRARDVRARRVKTLAPFQRLRRRAQGDEKKNLNSRDSVAFAPIAQNSRTALKFTRIWKRRVLNDNEYKKIIKNV